MSTRPHSITFDPAEGRAKQSFKQECDINFIVDQFQKTGQFAHVNKRPPTYGDFTNVDDYQAARNAIIEADHAFAALPAAIRDRFENDPAELLEFLTDPDNLDEARELGLAPPPPDPVPVGPAADPVPTPPITPPGENAPISGGD